MWLAILLCIQLSLILQPQITVTRDTGSNDHLHVEHRQFAAEARQEMNLLRKQSQKGKWHFLADNVRLTKENGPKELEKFNKDLVPEKMDVEKKGKNKKGKTLFAFGRKPKSPQAIPIVKPKSAVEIEQLCAEEQKQKEEMETETKKLSILEMARGLSEKLAEKMDELQKEHADVVVNGPLVLRLETERQTNMKEMERAKEEHKSFLLEEIRRLDKKEMRDTYAKWEENEKKNLKENLDKINEEFMAAKMEFDGGMKQLKLEYEKLGKPKRFMHFFRIKRKKSSNKFNNPEIGPKEAGMECRQLDTDSMELTQLMAAVAAEEQALPILNSPSGGGPQFKAIFNAAMIAAPVVFKKLIKSKSKRRNAREAVASVIGGNQPAATGMLDNFIRWAEMKVKEVESTKPEARVDCPQEHLWDDKFFASTGSKSSSMSISTTSLSSSSSSSSIGSNSSPPNSDSEFDRIVDMADNSSGSEEWDIVSAEEEPNLPQIDKKKIVEKKFFSFCKDKDKTKEMQKLLTSFGRVKQLKAEMDGKDTEVIKMQEKFMEDAKKKKEQLGLLEEEQMEGRQRWRMDQELNKQKLEALIEFGKKMKEELRKCKQKLNVLYSTSEAWTSLLEASAQITDKMESAKLQHKWAIQTLIAHQHTKQFSKLKVELMEEEELAVEIAEAKAEIKKIRTSRKTIWAQLGKGEDGEKFCQDFLLGEHFEDARSQWSSEDE